MRAPTAADLLGEPLVLQALEQAWKDSNRENPAQRHEEGGWIYIDEDNGNLAVRRASAGGQASLDLSTPPIVPGAVVIATFHTHPNPSADGWEPGPSSADKYLARFAGVPFLIRADDGFHTTGPDARRGGLARGPGYPP